MSTKLPENFRNIAFIILENPSKRGPDLAAGVACLWKAPRPFKGPWRVLLALRDPYEPLCRFVLRRKNLKLLNEWKS